MSTVQKPAVGCTFDVILTPLAQYDKTFDVIGSISQSPSQIWSTAAGYHELCMSFKPIRNGEIYNLPPVEPTPVLGPFG